RPVRCSPSDVSSTGPSAVSHTVEYTGAEAFGRLRAVTVVGVSSSAITAGLLVRLVMCVAIRSTVRLRVVGPEQMSEIGPPGAGRRQRLCPRLPTARAPTRGEIAH